MRKINGTINKLLQINFIFNDSLKIISNEWAIIVTKSNDMGEYQWEL